MRKAKVIRYSNDGKRAICIDLENWEAIFEYVNRSDKNKKKFNYIVNIILENHRVPDVYDKEDINNKAKKVTAMKFFKGQSNDRLYCKEMTLEDRTFVVIAAELFEKKKDQGIKQKLRNLIEKVGSYEYETIR
jgi:hypothetical protein